MTEARTTLSPPRPQLQRSNASAHPVLQGSDYGAETFGRGMRHPKLSFSGLAEFSASPQSAGSTPLVSPSLQREAMPGNDLCLGPRLPSRFDAMRASPIDMLRSASSDSATRPTLRSKLSRKDLKDSSNVGSRTASPLPPVNRSRSGSTSSGKSGRAASSSSLASSSSMASHSGKSRFSDCNIDEEGGQVWIFDCASANEFDQARFKMLREISGESAKQQQGRLDALFDRLSTIVGGDHVSDEAMSDARSERSVVTSPTYKSERGDEAHFLDFSQYICPMPESRAAVPAKSAPSSLGVPESVQGERTPRPTDYQRFAEDQAAALPVSIQSRTSSHQHGCRDRSYSTAGRRPNLDTARRDANVTQEGRERVRSPPSHAQALPCLPEWAKADNRLHQERLHAQRDHELARTRSSDTNERAVRPAAMHRALTHDVGSLHPRDNPMLPRNASPQPNYAPLPGLQRSRLPAPITTSNETPKASRTQQWSHTPGNASFDSSTSDSCTSSDYSSVPQTPVSRTHMLHDAASVHGKDAVTLPQSDSEIIDLFMASKAARFNPQSPERALNISTKDATLDLDQLPPWARAAELSPSRATPRAEYFQSKEYPHFSAAISRKNHTSPTDEVAPSLPMSSSFNSNVSQSSPARANKFLPFGNFNSQDSQLTVRGEHIMRVSTPQQSSVLSRPRPTPRSSKATDYGKEPDLFSIPTTQSPSKSQSSESPSSASAWTASLRRGQNAAGGDAEYDNASVLSDVSHSSAASYTSEASSASNLSSAGRAKTTLLSYMHTSPKSRARRSPENVGSG